MKTHEKLHYYAVYDVSELTTRRDIIYVDTETTGLEDDDEIVEIAIGRQNYDKIEIVYHNYFKPKKPLSEQASAINGITNEFLNDYHEISKEDVETISKLLADNVVVGWNVGYDMRLWEQTLNIHDYNHNKLNVHTYDCMKLFQDYFQTGTVWLKQNEVQQAFQMTEEKHTATDDVKDMFRLVRCLNSKKDVNGNPLPTDILPYLSPKKQQYLLDIRRKRGG